MGTLCGGTQLPNGTSMQDTTVNVHGDILIADVRSALSVLKICEIKYHHRGTDVITQAKAGENIDAVMSLASHSPILEEKPSGKKHVGSSHEILMELCLKDQRMAAKRDAKGKMQKYKGANIPNLYPQMFEKQIQNMLEWYLLKLKPHSLHFFNQVSKAIKFETENGYDENPRTADQKQMKKDIDSNSETITSVSMGHIHAALEAFNNQFKQNAAQNTNSMSNDRVQFSACAQFTVMDIILFNEIFQILHMYEVFINNSKTKLCIDIRNNSANGNYTGINELFSYSNVKKWYENIAKSTEGKALTHFNSEFKTKFEEKLKPQNLAAGSLKNADFLNKLNSLRAAGPPGAGMKY